MPLSVDREIDITKVNPGEGDSAKSLDTLVLQTLVEAFIELHWKYPSIPRPVTNNQYLLCKYTPSTSWKFRFTLYYIVTPIIPINTQRLLWTEIQSDSLAELAEALAIAERTLDQ